MWSSARPVGGANGAPDSLAARRRAFLALSCGLVLLCLAVGSGALASSRTAQVHGAASVPDLSGLWQNKADSVSPPWRLQASNGLQTLDVGWRGNQADGHPDLRGSFHGTLRYPGDVYRGSYHVTEGSVKSNGLMSVKIDSANQVEITLQAENGGGPTTYTFIRKSSGPSISRAKTPGAFDATVSEPAPPPKGEALDASPKLGAATAVTATEHGVSPDDLAFYVAAVVELERRYCYFANVKRVSLAFQGTKPKSVDTLTYIRGLEIAGDALFTNVAECMASADTLGKVLDSLQKGGAARAAASSCQTTPAKIKSKGKGGNRHVKKISVGGLKGVSVSCTLNAGVLRLHVASKSGKPLRKLVGRELLVGVRRSKKDSKGGNMSFSFHKS